MKNLRHLSEITTRYGTRNINELEFDSPEEFAAYKKKHKLRKGTVVKVAGKDKKIGDDKPKGKKTADTLTKGLKDGGLNPYKDGPLINQALDDIGGDHSDLKKRIDTYGDNVPSSKGKSEAQYQKEIDKYKEEGEKLSNDIADAVSDKPKGRRMQITMDFNNASREDLEGFAKKYDLKLGIVDNNPNYGLEAEFEGSEENLKRFMTSDDYGLDEKDFDDYAREYGDVLDDDESETESKPYSAKDEIDDAIDQGDGDTAMELFQSEVGFKKMGKDGKEAKKLLDRLADYEYGLIDLDDEEQDDIKGRLKQLSKKHIKESKISKLRELSKITTRYNKWLS